jgi:hypothetical protein
MPNVECRMPNAECRMQNAERAAEAFDRMMSSRHGFVWSLRPAPDAAREVCS